MCFIVTNWNYPLFFCVLKLIWGYAYIILHRATGKKNVYIFLQGGSLQISFLLARIGQDIFPRKVERYGENVGAITALEYVKREIL